MKKNYYIQGDPAKAEQIKVSFERLGINVLGFGFADKTVVYCSIGECVQYLPYSINLMNILYSHPDYQELPLHVKSNPKFKSGTWLWHKTKGVIPLMVEDYDEKEGYLMLMQYPESKCYFGRDIIENDYRLWEISDAKEGDVLAVDWNEEDGHVQKDGSVKWQKIVIFKSINKVGVEGYGCTFRNNKLAFDTDVPYYSTTWTHTLKPAIKKQRDLLFQKMKEEGYVWDDEKKELRKIIKPKFKVGDKIEATIYGINRRVTIRGVDKTNRCYLGTLAECIGFSEQDQWHLAPKLHYDISSFHEGMPVLVRDDNTDEWNYLFFSHYRKKMPDHFIAGGNPWYECIPFNEETKHLLGTTDMCDEKYINW